MPSQSLAFCCQFSEASSAFFPRALSTHLYRGENDGSEKDRKIQAVDSMPRLTEMGLLGFSLTKPGILHLQGSSSGLRESVVSFTWR